MDINAGYVQSFYGLHMVCRMGAICLLRQSGLDHQKGGLAIFCFNHKLNVKCGLEPFFFNQSFNQSFNLNHFQRDPMFTKLGFPR